MVSGKTKNTNSPARVRKAAASKDSSIKRLLMPDFMVLCQDFVRGADNDLSIIKTIDFIKPDHLPYTPARLIVIATFFRLPTGSIDEFRRLAPEFRLTVHTPDQREVEVGTFAVSEISERDPWLMERLIVDLSDSIEFTSSGPYRFLVEGKTADSEFEALNWRLLPIAEPAIGKKQIARA